jgi:O-antigen/teichoic acid export membrane protein
LRNLKKISTLYSGTFVSQGINLIVFFWAASFFKEEPIANYFILVALSEIITSMTSLQSHLTIVLGKSKLDRQYNLVYSILINILNSLIILSLATLFFSLIPDSKVLFLKQVFYFIPLTVFCLGINFSYENYFIAEGKIKVVTAGKLLRTTLFGITLLYMFYAKNKNPLAWSYLTSIVVLLIFNLLIAGKSVIFLLKKTSHSGLITYIIKYKKIIGLNTLTTPINIFSNQLPYLALPFLYGSGVTANYGILFKTIFFPLLLFSQVYGQLFYKHISERIIQLKEIKHMYYKALRSLFLSGLMPFVIISILSPWFFQYILNGKWAFAGSIAQLITPMVFITFIKSPLSSVIAPLGIQKKWFIFETTQLLLRILLFYTCLILLLSVQQTILFFSLLNVLTGISLLVLLYQNVITYNHHKITEK